MNPSLTEEQVRALAKIDLEAALAHPCCPVDLWQTHLRTHYAAIEKNPRLTLWALEAPEQYTRLVAVGRYSQARNEIQAMLQRALPIDSYHPEGDLVGWLQKAREAQQNARRLVAWLASCASQLSPLWRGYAPFDKRPQKAIRAALRWIAFREVDYAFAEVAAEAAFEVEDDDEDTREGDPRRAARAAQETIDTAAMFFYLEPKLEKVIKVQTDALNARAAAKKAPHPKDLALTDETLQALQLFLEKASTVGLSTQYILEELLPAADEISDVSDYRRIRGRNEFVIKALERLRLDLGSIEPSEEETLSTVRSLCETRILFCNLYQNLGAAEAALQEYTSTAQATKEHTEELITHAIEGVCEFANALEKDGEPLLESTARLEGQLQRLRAFLRGDVLWVERCLQRTHNLERFDPSRPRE